MVAKRKNIIICVATLMLTLVIGYYFIRGTTNSSPSKFDKIIIGTETWTGYFPLYLAQELGYFRNEGLNVEVKRYTSLKQLSQDYQVGKLHGRANLTLDAVREALNGMDHKAVLAIDYSNGSDSIIGRKGIYNIADLKGKSVAFESNTLEEFFVLWALNESGMSLADIIPVTSNPEESARKLVEGQVDASVTHEPFYSQIIAKNSDINVLYSSANAPGVITDILTFRTDFIENHPEVIPKIIRAYFKALRYWSDKTQEANLLTAKAFGGTSEGISKQLEGIKMLNEQENKAVFTYTQGDDSIYNNMRRSKNFIMSNHKDGDLKEIDTDELIEPRFLRKVLKERL